MLALGQIAQPDPPEEFGQIGAGGFVTGWPDAFFQPDRRGPEPSCQDKRQAIPGNQ